MENIFWPLTNFFAKKNLEKSSVIRLNLGCSDVKVEGFTNVDIRRTRATDITTDLNLPDFRANSIDCVFSNAFFEHLYRSRRVAHLTRCRESLKDSGHLCYIGLPFFPNIAKAYLDGAPGIVGPRFDLYNVFRYSHGDPDNKPDWYFEQLHKSLFDFEEASQIMKEAGFSSYAIFTYHYPTEALAVNSGMFGIKGNASPSELQKRCLDFLKQFDGRFIDLPTIKFL